MASIKEKKSSSVSIDLTNKYYCKIHVATVILDDDVACFHCGKNLKSGKIVCISSDLMDPTIDKNGWGEYRESVFCSSIHAKLFAKNKKGL